MTQTNGRWKREGGGKPNSVPRKVTIIHLGPVLRQGSSDLPDPCDETGRLAALSRIGSYLVLLRTGFTMPERSPFPRCALTAPFHPYLVPHVREGGVFSVALSLGFPPVVVSHRPAL